MQRCPMKISPNVSNENSIVPNENKLHKCRYCGFPDVSVSPCPCSSMDGYTDYEGSGLELVHVADVLEYLGTFTFLQTNLRK